MYLPTVKANGRNWLMIGTDFTERNKQNNLTKKPKTTPLS